LGEVGIECKAKSVAEPSVSICLAAPNGARIPRILLAEDDPYNRKAFGALFKMSGHNFDLAEDGLTAVEMWEKGEYDLVLMDIQMPRLNGLEATKAIREKEQNRSGHTKIVALTANAFNEDKERCLAAGMDAYISKPIDINKFLLLIESFNK
jgi:CheY-like chemotaxis protein